MEAALDRFGRVVIPKKIRDHMGLDPGSVLSIEESEGRIILKPVVETVPVTMKEGVLVFTGKAADDIENAVRKHREERLGGSW
jgi:AbrB family looped-hinge helix DNA binding protein